VRLFAQNAGFAEGINWGTCNSNVPGSTITDASGINWLVIDVAGTHGFPAVVSAATEAYGVALDSNSDVFAVGGSSTAELHPSLPGPAPTPGGYDWLGQADTYWSGTGAWIVKLHGHDTSTGSRDAGWPVKSYVTALGKNETSNGTVDTARGVAIDSQGSAYVVGTTTGTLLSATGLNQAPLGHTDAFVLKMETPSKVDYATYLGGTKNDQGLGIAVGTGGSAYIVGSTQSTDIPVVNAVIDGNGNTLNSLRGTQNAYLAKLTPDGTALMMSAYLGGCCLDSGNAIALSKTGNGDIYVAGTTTSSTNFPIVPLESPANDVLGRSAYAGNGDAFVTRISGASFPKITPSPTNLNFPSQAEYWASTSASTSWNTVTLTNSGTGTLNFISPGITASGDFSVSNNNCGTPPNAQLAAGASCSVTVVFTPTQAIPRSGVLTIPDDALDSPQTVGLSGTGVLVGDTVSTTPATTPVALSFGTFVVGTASPAQTLTVTVTNTDTNGQRLIMSQPVVSTTLPGVNEFGLGLNTCNTNLLPGQSCTIAVTFTPNAAGSQSGKLILTGNGTTFPQTIPLTGTGSGTSLSPQGACAVTDICVTGPTTAVTVTRGSTSPAFNITVTIPSGFTGSSIALNCAPPANVTCTILPNPIPVVSGTTTYTAQVTVSMPAGNTITITGLMKPGRLLATLLPFGGIGLIFAGRRRRWLLMLGLVVCLALGMVSCGGGGGSSSNGSQQQLQITTTPAGSQALIVPLTVK
jgi:hypothetical protein